MKLAWNVDREDFMETVDVVSQLRLRASWGESGNDQIGNFDALGLYGSGAIYNGASGINFTQLANANLRWERNQMFNIGIDFASNKNILSGTLEFYFKKRRRLIW